MMMMMIMRMRTLEKSQRKTVMKVKKKEQHRAVLPEILYTVP
jgi:hypothetical protein